MSAAQRTHAADTGRLDERPVARAHRWSSAGLTFHDDHRRRSSSIVEQQGARAVDICFSRSRSSVLLILGRLARLSWSCDGIGVWGSTTPVGWAWDITNFVFWIGIGHAGTLISAILFLFRQKWRTASTAPPKR